MLWNLTCQRVCPGDLKRIYCKKITIRYTVWHVSTNEAYSCPHKKQAVAPCSHRATSFEMHQLRRASPYASRMCKLRHVSRQAGYRRSGQNRQKREKTERKKQSCCKVTALLFYLVSFPVRLALLISYVQPAPFKIDRYAVSL